MKRKRYSKDFKARVALEAIKGQKTANELASEYEVHVSQINTWKKQALAALPEVFGRGQELEEAQHEAENGIDRLETRRQMDHGDHPLCLSRTFRTDRLELPGLASSSEST